MVLRIIPAGDGTTHNVHHRGRWLGQVVKRSEGTCPWDFRLPDSHALSVRSGGPESGGWPSRSGAAVALAIVHGSALGKAVSP